MLHVNVLRRGKSTGQSISIECASAPGDSGLIDTLTHRPKMCVVVVTTVGVCIVKSCVINERERERERERKERDSNNYSLSIT